jgi:2-phospho-L-lactate guanylyltransferase
VATIVVPFRSGGKSRLPAAIRVEVALAMLGDVLEAAAAHGDRVRLVTADDAAASLAAALCVEVVDDPGGGQGAAVQAGLQGAEGVCLVVNADLPCASVAALARLVAARPALVAASDRTTNALSLLDPGLFEPSYGPGSADRFGAAGFRAVAIPELEQDVDTLADLQRLALPTGRRTTLVVNHHNLELERAS